MTRLLVLFVTAFVDMVGLTMIIPLLPFYATELGASATVVGLLVSAFAVAQLVVAPVWGRFSDRYGRRPAILAGLLLTGSAYVIFAFAGSVLVLLLSRLVQGAGGGTIGVVQAYVADASPPEERWGGRWIFWGRRGSLDWGSSCWRRASAARASPPTAASSSSVSP